MEKKSKLTPEMLSDISGGILTVQNPMTGESFSFKQEEDEIVKTSLSPGSEQTVTRQSVADFKSSLPDYLQNQDINTVMKKIASDKINVQHIFYT